MDNILIQIKLQQAQAAMQTLNIVNYDSESFWFELNNVIDSLNAIKEIAKNDKES